MLSLLLASVLAAVPQTCLYNDAPKTELAVLGIAKPLADVQKNQEQVLYCEFHYPINEHETLVNYVKNGKVFANKTLDFSTSLVAPKVDQIDFRTGEHRTATQEKTSPNKNWIIIYQEKTAKNEQQKIIAGDDGIVLDAGFDHYIRAQWQNLQTQSPVSFPFLSIPHLKTLMLRVESKPLTQCPPHKDAYACFKVGADNSFLRLFVGDIRLVYNQDKQLRLFEGVVNIQNTEGKSQSALIEYFY